MYAQIAAGEELTLPNFGLETGPTMFTLTMWRSLEASLAHWSISAGEATCCIACGSHLTRIRGTGLSLVWLSAQIKVLPFEAWRETVSQADADATYDHIAHSPNCSIAKAQAQLGFQPRYTPMQAIHEAPDWLVAHGQVRTQS